MDLLDFSIFQAKKILPISLFIKFIRKVRVQNYFFLSFPDASQAAFDGVSEVKLDTSAGQSKTVNLPLQTLILALNVVMILMQ